MTSRPLAPDVERRSRWWWIGVTLGVAPQVLFFVFLMLRLSVADAEERPFLLLFGLLNIYVVPVALLVGIPCLFASQTRQFGRALVGGTLVGATVFSVVCCGVSNGGTM